MSLCLTITSYHKITPGQCVEITLDHAEMTIGRGLDNGWVLADPERLISSKHCVIKYVNGRYVVTDNSTNGVELVIAGIRLRRGNSEPLQDGEIIKIGGYEISARISSELSPDSKHLNFGESYSFDALMASAKSPSQTFEELPALPPVWTGSVQDTVSDLFDFLTPKSVPSPTRSDHVPIQQHGFSPPSAVPPAAVTEAVAGAHVIPADWDLFSGNPTPPVAESNRVDNPRSPSDPAPVQPSLLPAEPITTPSPGANSSALLTAFLRGAGLERLHLDDAQSDAQMELIGRSYRRMVEGLIDILRARSSLKGEFRLQQTMIRPLENNPLKFAPNADEALLLLLRHGNRAFMDADQAIEDSFNDLRAHQLAVMAGVEAAITALLKRFEPTELEARMGDTGALSRLFGSRQAQCWQRFTELYADISQEAEDDFPELFGREFARAYEQHNARSREG
jgi:type VI secretion system protein